MVRSAEIQKSFKSLKLLLEALVGTLSKTYGAQTGTIFSQKILLALYLIELKRL